MERSKYWIVKLGKLYYTCGLSRQAQDYTDAISFEMTSEEMVAWPFRHVEIAVSIAEEIGGIVIEKEGEIETYISHAERNREYLSSLPQTENQYIRFHKEKKGRINRKGKRVYR